jgi:hypothetical protein
MKPFEAKKIKNKKWWSFPLSLMKIDEGETAIAISSSIAQCLYGK